MGSTIVKRIADLVFLICLAAGLHAQSTTGLISGVVQDTQGRVLPGATVPVTETSTGVVRTATTDASGSYVFVSLPLGTYSVSARDYWYSTARDWRELEDAKSVGRTAGERSVRRLGARQLGTMKVPVLYTPDVARGLISHFLAPSAAAASTDVRRSCSMPPGSKCFRTGSRCPSGRTSREPSPARRSITKA